MNNKKDITRGTVSVHEVLAYIRAERYMSKKHAAEYVDMSLREFERCVMPFVPAARANGRIRYLKSHLDMFMQGKMNAGNHNTTEHCDVEQMVSGILQKVKA